MQETVSALDACREVLDEKDATVKMVWEQIIEDEAHHAAFAWKVVRWAIEKNGKPDQKVLKLVDEIVSPQSLEKIGKGEYKQDDITLLCGLKDKLLCLYGQEAKAAVTCENLVGNRVMEVLA